MIRSSMELLSNIALFRDFLSTHILFTVGILLLVGYYIGRLAGTVKLPEITGFIIAGLLMGESITGIVPHHMGQTLSTITEVALGLIALTIGGEFYWGKLKRMGREGGIITALQLLVTFLVVALGMLLFRMPLPFALLLGAIASATAPAATVAIVQSLRARGKFIDYLYGVVALDDAGCVILFGVIFAFAGSMLAAGGEHIAAGAVIFHALSEVVLSIVLGIFSGAIVHLLTRKKSTNEIIIITIGLIFLTTAVAVLFHLSPLLVNMAAGAVIINLSPSNHRIFRIIEPLTPPIYALFFVIAGTELNPAIFFQGDILLVGIAYILFRAVGKYGGVYSGACIAGAEREIKNYLGICMLPQAGVAIGLVLMIQTSPVTAAMGAENIARVDMLVNIILLSVFVNELIGPSLSRFAIIRGNEMEE